MQQFFRHPKYSKLYEKVPFKLVSQKFSAGLRKRVEESGGFRKLFEVVTRLEALFARPAVVGVFSGR